MKHKLALAISLLLPASIFCFAEKAFVVIVPSYNNAKYYEKNLESILNQNYSNYRIIYTDDQSDDNTADLVKEYLEKHDSKKRTTLIKNTTRKKALHNIYDMVHSCSDNEIIVSVDGDDWLKDNNVLKSLNELYSKNKIWLSYGSYEKFPKGERGAGSWYPRRVVQTNSFRHEAFRSSHLRTFYAWLFQRIKKEDLMLEGEFFDMTWDVAFMLPMLEMAGNRYMFNDKILYVYNMSNPIADCIVGKMPEGKQHRQCMLEDLIKTKPRYRRLPINFK